eukprot:1054470-Amphidinium_carterae.1
MDSEFGSCHVSSLLASLPNPWNVACRKCQYSLRSGIDPGPGGLYGLIEGACCNQGIAAESIYSVQVVVRIVLHGIASLSVLVTCVWSATSFLTRARGLPAGLFNLLGTTQVHAETMDPRCICTAS